MGAQEGHPEELRRVREGETGNEKDPENLPGKGEQLWRGGEQDIPQRETGCARAGGR